MARGERVLGVQTPSLVPECPRGAALEEERVEPRVGHTAPYAERRVETRTHVAYFMEIGPYPAVPNRGVVLAHIAWGGGARLRYVRFCEYVCRCLGCEHPRLHGVVGAFDFRDVDEPCRTPDQSTAWEVEFGNGLQTALVQRASTIRNASRVTRQELCEIRVVLHALRL